MWYHVSEPTAYLAITGARIDKVLVRKKYFLLPFQKVTKFSITPFDFPLSLQAMTVEKLNFMLPAVFTIGPDDNPTSLAKYAALLTGEGDKSVSTRSGALEVAEGRSHVQNIVKGIIEGETRSIVSTMTMEELFKERKMFRDHVIKNVQSELDQFGLKIYNANVKELHDTPGSEYFAYLSRKAHEGALNQAKVDVAEARMKGEVGESQRQGQAKQEIAKIHADTAVKETQRKSEKAQADAELSKVNIEIEKKLNLDRIEAARTAEQRDAELQKIVESKRAEMELERQRATTVTKAIIARESDQQKADALLYTQEKNALATKAQALADTDADFYKSQKDAEALFERTRLSAEGKKLEADAQFYAKKQQAQGLMEMAKAYGELATVLGGPQGLLHWMMLERGTYEKMAEQNAKAVHGMQPKINVWNTGSDASGADPSAPIRNLFQSLPPMLETIQQQTGMMPPNWLAQMPQQSQEEPKMNGIKKY